MNSKVFVIAAISIVATTAEAYVIDFESSAATSSNFVYPGGYTSLNYTFGADLVEIKRTSGGAFDVTNNATMSNLPASWGNRSLAPFTTNTNDWFVVNFLNHVATEVVIEGGDYGGDDDNLMFEAYSGLDGTGSLVLNGSVNYGSATFPTISELNLTFGSDVRSILVRGGSALFPNSFFLDNLEITSAPVPEPATFGVIGLGLAAIARRRRRA